MSEFIKKLVAIQAELKAPKGQTNTFGKYKYRSAEDILEAVKPLNAKHELFLSLSDEPMLIGDWHYIKSTATITDGENTHTVTAFARESMEKKGMDHSQITGTASSYARKYALNGLYLIDDTKDADTDEYQKNQQRTAPKQQQQRQQQQQQQQPQPPVNPNAISAAQIKAIGTKTGLIAKNTGKEQLEVYQGAQQALGINKSTRELTKSEASKFIEYLANLE